MGRWDGVTASGREEEAADGKGREMKMIGGRLRDEMRRLGDKFGPDSCEWSAGVADQIGHNCPKKTIFGIDILKRVLDTSLGE